MTIKQKAKLERYSAKLLFQFRVVVGGVSNKRRTCEERIINLRSGTANQALKMAKQYGARESHSYKNDSGALVHFEFVGVTDLQHLGVECDEIEVWYGVKDMVSPMERRAQLVPPENKLNAIAWEHADNKGLNATARKRVTR